MKESGTQKRGSSLLETRRRNRVFIKDTIFRREPVTRTAIAEELGLTLPTITTSVNEMMAEGLLRETPLPEEELAGNAGRRPTVLSFEEKAAFAVGAELGPYATRAVLLDLGGNVLAQSQEAAGDASYEAALGRLAAQITALLRGFSREKLLGVGVGLPGFIEAGEGLIRSSRNADWTGRRLAADLERRLALPVLIDNNVRLRAMGYGMELRGERRDSFAYFYISRGIACPLLVKDDVLSGYTAGAGEIGHTVLCTRTDGGKESALTLDELAGEQALLAQCAQAMQEGRAPLLRHLAEQSGELTAKQLLEAQQEGEEAVCAILEKGIEYLGMALANVVNFINPGFVVVDGYLMRRPENARRLERAAKSRFFGLNEEEVEIFFQEFDHYSGARGAAYCIFRRLLLEK